MLITNKTAFCRVKTECGTILGKDDKIARNCLVSTLHSTVMQMSKVNCEKGYYWSLEKQLVLFSLEYPCLHRLMDLGKHGDSWESKTVSLGLFTSTKDIPRMHKALLTSMVPAHELFHFHSVVYVAMTILFGFPYVFQGNTRESVSLQILKLILKYFLKYEQMRCSDLVPMSGHGARALK